MSDLNAAISTRRLGGCGTMTIDYFQEENLARLERMALDRMPADVAPRVCAKTARQIARRLYHALDEEIARFCREHPMSLPEAER